MGETNVMGMRTTGPEFFATNSMDDYKNGSGAGKGAQFRFPVLSVRAPHVEDSWCSCYFCAPKRAGDGQEVENPLS